MTVNSMTDAENSRTLRERILKTLPDQTTLDSFFIDYFPEIKRNRFASISNREDQINRIIESAGLQALQTAFGHYVRQIQANTALNKSPRRIAVTYFLVGLLGSILITTIVLYLLMPEYRAFQRASELQSSCNKGNYINCHRLVQHYTNRCEARKWDDCINLGDYYWLQQNKSEAFVYYKKACSHDQQLGCYYTALLTETGDGVPTDQNWAKTNYERLCTSKLDKACVRLGDMYWSGRAVSKNPLAALGLYQSACEQNNPTGCYRIGQMYETGADKVPLNIDLSYQYYDQACNRQGYLPSCLRLGLLYYTQKIQDADNSLAQRAFEKACDHGSGELDACINLGLIFENGLNGNKSPERAIAEYKNACDRKNAGGCTNLGLLYNHPNTPYHNREQGLTLLKNSCETGFDLACYNYAAIWFTDKRNQANQPSVDHGSVTIPTTLLIESCRRRYKKSCSLLGELVLRNQVERGAALMALGQICTSKDERPSNSGCEAWMQFQPNSAGTLTAR